MALSFIQGLIICLCSLTVVFVLSSFAQVHTLQSCLDYNHLTQTVGKQPLRNGLVFLGAPWHSLITYPGTLQNIVFSTADTPHDELHARTSDGLQVVLEVTFQYEVIRNELHELFEDFGEDGYEAVYFDVASHLITQGATSYSAYEFFNSKESIASALQVSLNDHFSEYLHAYVVSVQIQSCHLPDEFNQAILDTMTQRQNITNTAKFLDQQKVTLETNILVAHKQANATIAIARGQAAQLYLQAEAASSVATQNGLAEASSYHRVKKELGFTNDELLRYIWWDAVGSVGSNDASMLVGISPSTLLQSP